jgi:hydroxymethylbilane synthase
VSERALLRMGTRGSALAVAQSNQVRATLEARHPGLTVEPVLIKTTGDRLQRGPLAPAGGKGLFVKEIEEALAARTVDFAVHSMKDLPATLAPGMIVAAIPTRADARDVLITSADGFAGLPKGARVGTASLRRRTLVLARRPDVEILVLRGNVDTRLRRWRDGELDAILLAAAGLARLGIEEPAARPLSIDEFLPAVGQGALALVCRGDDARTRALLGAVQDEATAAAVTAERAFLVGVGGDCNTPLAAHAVVSGGRVSLRALVADHDGRRMIEDADSAATGDACVLGRTIADRLLARGARELLGA